MKPPDSVLSDHIRQWIAKAEIDYRTAESPLRDAEPIRESIAFHCQQTAEKYSKALLVSLKVEFPKTHDLEVLLDLLTPIRPEASASLDDIKLLSQFGVKIRYPGDFPQLLPGQERWVYELACRARQVVLAQLNQHLAGS